MGAPHYIRGYHATTRKHADDILLNGFRPREQSYHWLGQGIYFYQDAPTFAYHWAKYHRKRGRIPEPVILGADIQFDRVMDLADYRWGRVLTDAYNALSAAANPSFTKARDMQVAVEPGKLQATPHWLDCMVIEEAILQLSKAVSLAPGEQYFTSVRGIFLEGEELYPKAHLFDRSHIQISVRDKDAIDRVWEEEGPFE